MKTNPHNLNTSHLRFNESRIRRYKRFLEKNKLDNALMVADSGEVVDLYSEAIWSRWNRHLGFLALIWMRSCRKLANKFRCMGRFFSKAGDLVWWFRT